MNELSTAEPPIAGIIAPPPVLYLGTLIAGIGLHLFLPLPLWGIILPMVVRVIMGVALFVLGAWIARWSFQTMRSIGTTGNPRAESTALATHGAFRLSRNPIYLAMTIMYIGITFWVDSVWLLIFLIPLLITMQWGVLLREERYLTQQFGQAYKDYMHAVRRWL